MRNEALPFVGTLFTGLMITKNGPKSWNTMFDLGDPETQTLLPLMETDLAKVMIACTDHYLSAVSVDVKPGASVTVVVAAGGYPGSYAKGTPMDVQAPPESTNIFHAGTTIRMGNCKLLGEE